MGYCSSLPLFIVQALAKRSALQCFPPKEYKSCVCPLFLSTIDQRFNGINQQLTQLSSNANLNNAVNNLQSQITEALNQRNAINANHNGLRNEFHELKGFTHGKIGEINQNVANLKIHADNILKHADNILNHANHRVNELKTKLKEGLFCVLRGDYCSKDNFNGVRDALENWLAT
uniref:Uncharacterized protein n=1 Tax=Panagrolaimus sp. ES5 TaxID=591445 RepID=A0AC34G4K6_9BILA